MFLLEEDFYKLVSLVEVLLALCQFLRSGGLIHLFSSLHLQSSVLI